MIFSNDHEIDYKLCKTAEVKYDIFRIYLSDRNLENKFLECYSADDKILLKKSCLFMILFYIYAIILGVFIGWPKMFYLFPIILIVYIFVVAFLLKYFSQKITKLIVHIKAFLLILTFEIFFTHFLDNNFTDTFFLNITKMLIIFKNIFIILIIEPGLLLSISYSVVCCGSIVFFLVLKNCGFVYIIQNVFIELMVSSFIYSLKMNYEIQKRRAFIDNQLLISENSIYKEHSSIINNYHFSIKDNKFIYLNKEFAKFLRKNFRKELPIQSNDYLKYRECKSTMKISQIFECNNLFRNGIRKFLI